MEIRLDVDRIEGDPGWWCRGNDNCGFVILCQDSKDQLSEIIEHENVYENH